MKTIAAFLGIILAALLALALGGGLLILIAYGVGWVISRSAGFEIFQSTALGLAGVFVFIFLVERLISAFAPLNSFGNYASDDEFDDEDEDEFDDEYDDEFDDEFNGMAHDKLSPADQAELDKVYAAIPRWRRPTKNLDFSNTLPDHRCPCGSGRKYKNCHGKQKQ
jgi:hypothetical protein